MGTTLVPSGSISGYYCGLSFLLAFAFLLNLLSFYLYLLTTWAIKYVWQLADGSKKKNVYRGEKNFDELQKAFAAIPEIAALIEEIKSE